MTIYKRVSLISKENQQYRNFLRQILLGRWKKDNPDVGGVCGVLIEDAVRKWIDL